jgi:hypothetical protein
MKTELEVEKLAQKHCENFMNECALKNMDEAKLASQKLTAVAYDLMKAVHEGKSEIVQ